MLLSFALKNHLRLSLLQKNRYTFEPLFLVERIDMVLGTKCDLTGCWLRSSLSKVAILGTLSNILKVNGLGYSLPVSNYF